MVRVLVVSGFVRECLVIAFIFWDACRTMSGVPNNMEHSRAGYSKLCRRGASTDRFSPWKVIRHKACTAESYALSDYTTCLGRRPKKHHQDNVLKAWQRGRVAFLSAMQRLPPSGVRYSEERFEATVMWYRDKPPLSMSYMK